VSERVSEGGVLLVPCLLSLYLSSQDSIQDSAYSTVKQ
jgi:hypothetical protein